MTDAPNPYADLEAQIAPKPAPYADLEKQAGDTGVPTRDASGALMAGKNTGASNLDDIAKSALTGIGRGVAEIPGGINDLGYLAQMGIGKFSKWAGGPQFINDQEDVGRAGLSDPSHFGVASTDKFLDDHTVLGYKPQTSAGQTAQSVGNFIGQSAGTGVAKAGLSGATALAKSVLPELALGVGGGLGNEVGKGVADKAGWDQDSPVKRTIAELVGAVLGSRTAGGIANRTALFEKPQISQDFEDAGVTPSMPSDINGDGGFLSETLPNMFGAKGAMRRSANDTQAELRNSVKTQLDPSSVFRDVNDTPTTQDVGTSIKNMVADQHADLSDQVNQAYADLGKTLGGQDVSLSNTFNAINDVTGKVSSPEIADVLKQNPALARYQRLADAGVVDAKWDDVDALRRDVGQQIGSTTNASERGVLKQIYKAISEDITQTADRVTGGNGEALMANANGKAKALSALEDASFDPLTAKDPENIVSWLMANSRKGDTRLKTLFDSLSDSYHTGDIGSQIIHELGYTSGNEWDLPTLMKNWKTLSPEAQDALTGDPRIRDVMSRTGRLWDATAMSRGVGTTRTADGIMPLVQQSGIGGSLGSLVGGALSSGGDTVVDTIHNLTHGGATGLAVGSALPAALGLAARGTASLATNPSLLHRFAAPVAGDMMNPSQMYSSAARGGALSDVAPAGPAPFYQAPPAPPSPERHSEYLADPNTPLADKIAFVAARVPTIASQLATGSEEGNGAALSLALLNPQYRNQLG